MPFVDKNIWVAAGDGDLSRVRVSRVSYHLHFRSSRGVVTGADRAPMQAFCVYYSTVLIFIAHSIVP